MQYLTIDQAIMDSCCYLVTGIICNDVFPKDSFNTDKPGAHDKYWTGSQNLQIPNCH